MIITIDGTAGTGKSTVAKKVAEALHMAYFDTGAMYRAFAYFVLSHQLPIHDEGKITAALVDFRFHFEGTGTHKRYVVNQEEVSSHLRTPEVTEVSSVVSQYSQVRKTLLEVQKKFAHTHDVVFEGRDLGTVIFPEAEHKFFLIASDQVRAERRHHEMIAKGIDISLKEVLESIQKRDERDKSRKVAPLRCAEDAIKIDTSDKSIEEVVNLILDKVKR